MVKILGLDPGLRCTGWGIIEFNNNNLRYCDGGFIKVMENAPTSERLLDLFSKLSEIIKKFNPKEAAVEEIFLNKNPISTIKLSMARGIALLAPAQGNIPVFEYPPNVVKKSIVGSGHADKQQVSHMVFHLLPNLQNLIVKKDTTDALAIAICHAFSRTNFGLKF